MNRMNVTDRRSGVTVRVACYRGVYEVRDEDGEYVGFLDRRVNSSGNAEYRAAGCSEVWHHRIREAISELIGGKK